MMGNGLLEVAIDEKVTIYGARGKFNERVKSFEFKKAGVIPAKYLAYGTRLKRDSFLSIYGGLVREGCLNVSQKVYPQHGGGTLLLRDSLILESEDFIRRATESHAIDSRFYVSEETAKRYVDRLISGDKGILFLKKKEPAATNKFAHDERTVWLFQEEAEEIGRFLYDSGIKEMQFHFDRPEVISYEEPYANQLWLSLQGTDVRLRGNFRCLGDEKCFLYGWKNGKSKSP